MSGFYFEAEIVAQVCLPSSVVSEDDGFVPLAAVTCTFDLTHQIVALPPLRAPEEELAVPLRLQSKGVESIPHEEPRVHRLGHCQLRSRVRRRCAGRNYEPRKSVVDPIPSYLQRRRRP